MVGVSETMLCRWQKINDQGDKTVKSVTNTSIYIISNVRH